MATLSAKHLRTLQTNNKLGLRSQFIPLLVSLIQNSFLVALIQPLLRGRLVHRSQLRSGYLNDVQEVPGSAALFLSVSLNLSLYNGWHVDLQILVYLAQSLYPSI
ncbi:hypothetical protein RJT34_02647 [Clitoria ternatea]|uniref:Uncharacterized protein n=1 Tax=Clitoria ternatea TaxID=43366 RepID=A0AAN9PZ36_CLITE